MKYTACIGWLMISVAGCSLAAEGDPAPTDVSPATPSRNPGIFGHTFELAPKTVAPGVLFDAVEVCTNGGLLCTTTDHGTFFLEGVPEHSRFEVTFRKVGFVPVFQQVNVGEYAGFAEASLVSETVVQTLTVAASAPPLGETGGVIVQMMQPGYGVPEPLEGASFSVRSAEARSVYVDENGAADSARRSTSSAGWGAALGIAPGTVAIEARYEAGGRRCGVWSHEAADVVSSTTVEVRAGHFTMATMICLFAGDSRK